MNDVPEQSSLYFSTRRVLMHHGPRPVSPEDGFFSVRRSQTATCTSPPPVSLSSGPSRLQRASRSSNEGGLMRANASAVFPSGPDFLMVQHFVPLDLPQAFFDLTN